MQQLKEQLKKISQLPEFGAVDSVWMSKNKELLMMQVKNTIGFERRVARVPLIDSALISYALMYVRTLRSSFRLVGRSLRPALLVILAVIVPFGGWISTVNAALLSVAGEPLYGVKIFSEKVQLSLTSDHKTKITLRTQFASRRADEVTKLNLQAKVGNEIVDQDNIKTTIKRLENEMKTVDSELNILANHENPIDVLQVARAVDAKSAEIVKQLDRSSTILRNSPEIVSVKNVVNEVSVNAVETIVKKRAETNQLVNTVLDSEIKETLDGKLETASLQLNKVDSALGLVTSTSTQKIVQINASSTLQQVEHQVEVGRIAVVNATESVTNKTFEDALTRVKEVKTIVKEAEKLVAQLQKGDGSAVIQKDETSLTPAQNSTTTPKNLAVGTTSSAPSSTTSIKTEGSVKSNMIVEDEPLL